MQTTDNHKICVLGAGTWGWAITKVLQDNGHDVSLWSATGFNLRRLKDNRCHPRLANSKLDKDLLITHNLEEALEGAQIAVMVVASPYVRETAKKLALCSHPPRIIVSATKGLEKGTAKTMTQIICEELPHSKICAISGGSHAEEVIRGLPFALTCASKDKSVALLTEEIFRSPNVGLHLTNDLQGLELAAALKNIIAIAAGISDGAALGDNCRAALVTRGLSEIAEIGKLCGAKKRTFYEDCGIGDLLATAFSPHSRNRRFGLLIGRGLSKQAAFEEIGMAVEGLNALEGALLLASTMQIKAGFASLVKEIVEGNKLPESIADLVSNYR